MKITNVRLSALDMPGVGGPYDLVTIPNLRREPWIQAPGIHAPRSQTPATCQVMRVVTDEGIEGIYTVGETGGRRTITKHALEQLRMLVVGEDPLARERLYQKLHTGARWLDCDPGWAGTFDNCLWDIAGKAANLPVHAIIGKVRDRVPAYVNIRGATKEEVAADAAKWVSKGFLGVKDHFYHPVEENIRWFQAVREAAGPDADIMHDAVCIYNLEEAVRVGRVLEELRYRWFEEPLRERQHNKLRELCTILDIPVLATETLMFDVDICAQWLISGATDLIRANARTGTTPVLKLAHLAELYGTNVELNGTGGLFGLVNAHLLCCISNTSYYEFFPGGRFDEVGKEIGMLNPLVPVKGYLSPPSGPGWGAEWDWDYFQKRVVDEC